MNAQEVKQLRVKTEIVRRYYVELDGWIYAGPFDTKEEAKEALAEARSEPAREIAPY